MKCHKVARRTVATSSSFQQRISTKTSTVTTVIRCTCRGGCKNKDGGHLLHQQWKVLDEPVTDPAKDDEEVCYYHHDVQLKYYSTHHSVSSCNGPCQPYGKSSSEHRVLNDKWLWPTGVPPLTGNPAVVTGVYLTDSVAKGEIHCMTCHAAVLGLQQGFVTYNFKPSHPIVVNNWIGNVVGRPGFFGVPHMVNILDDMLTAGHLEIL